MASDFLLKTYGQEALFLNWCGEYGTLVSVDGDAFVGFSVFNLLQVSCGWSTVSARSFFIFNK